MFSRHAQVSRDTGREQAVGVLHEPLRADASVRILYVVNDADFFLSHRLPLAQAALANGYDVHVATPMDEAAKRIPSLAFSFHPIALGRRSTGLLTELRTLLHLYRLYRRIRPDIVHHVAVKSVIYGGLAARLLRLPAVVNALTGLGHVFISRSLKARILRPLIKAGFRFAMTHPNSVAIFQNTDDMTLFIRERIVSASATALIRGSGVDMEQFCPMEESPGTPLIVFASRLLWSKGVGEFVEAAKNLRGHVAARFVLVGDIDLGNPDTVSPSQIEAWKQQGIVELWGWRKNMVSIFREAHIVSLPSYREGVPKVLIEAAACGRAIVTTDTPGCREIVRHEVNGLLVPPRDAKALADALQRLIKNPEMRRRMGRAGREIAVAEFSLVQVVGETLAVYRKLLACRKF